MFKIIWKMLLIVFSLVVVFILAIVFVFIPYHGANLEVVNSNPLTIKVEQVGFSGRLGSIRFVSETDSLICVIETQSDTEIVVDLSKYEEVIKYLSENRSIKVRVGILADIPGTTEEVFILSNKLGKSNVVRLTSHYHSLW